MAPVISPEWTDQAGTVDDLLADARALGFPATKRLVHDWIGIGLLEHPVRRSKGQSGGSDKALFPWTQRNLFRLLVQKRPEVKTIAALCNIPVALWLWWGDEYVPTGQVQRALRTWAGERPSKVSWQTARRQARQLTDFFDDMGASRDQRSRLVDELAKVGYSGRLRDTEELTRAARTVFDPTGTGRVFGSALVSGSADDFVGLIAARVRGMERSRGPASLNELSRARAVYRDTRTQYALERPSLAQHLTRPSDKVLFAPEDLQQLFDRACTDLTLILGLQASSPPHDTANDGSHENGPGSTTARGLTTGGIDSHGKKRT